MPPITGILHKKSVTQNIPAKREGFIYKLTAICYDKTRNKGEANNCKSCKNQWKMCDEKKHVQYADITNIPLCSLLGIRPLFTVTIRDIHLSYSHMKIRGSWLCIHGHDSFYTLTWVKKNTKAHRCALQFVVWFCCIMASVE